MDAQQILETYRFDPESGTFAKLDIGRRRNTGIVHTPKGYVRVFVGGRYYMAHHLVWLLCHGTLPAMSIDHINGDRTDNRPSNLRQVSAVENSQNQRRPHSTNATGLLGVSPVRQPGLKSQRWKAQIKVNGKSVHLGNFVCPEAAHVAYLEAKRKLHPGCTI